MERMIFDEIKKSYPDEWVLLADPETDEILNLLSGIVVAHSTNRDDIYKRQLNLKGDYAIEYTGEIAKNKIFVL
ncbi:MAG: hypothetical protein ACE5I1_00420 [bacterium]